MDASSPPTRINDVAVLKPGIGHGNEKRHKSAAQQKHAKNRKPKIVGKTVGMIKKRPPTTRTGRLNIDYTDFLDMEALSKPTFCIPQGAIARIFKEISSREAAEWEAVEWHKYDKSIPQFRIQRTALNILHRAAEDFVTEFLSNANIVRLLQSHRETLLLRDLDVLAALDNGKRAMAEDVLECVKSNLHKHFGSSSKRKHGKSVTKE